MGIQTSVPPTRRPPVRNLPICDAHPGQRCETADNGWIQERGLAHVYRLKIAAENAK